jgi:hypothetical protein
MKRLGIGLLCAVAGYLIAAFAGYGLIEWFSSNGHDRSVEAAMTGLFVLGPFGAIVGFVAGFVAGGRRSGATPSHRVNKP